MVNSGFNLDSASVARLNLVYPDLAVRVKRLYQDMFSLHGKAMRATQGLRTMAEQAKLYAQGRTAPGHIVTNSPPGSSIHHYGAAVDSCFLGSDPFLEKLPKAEAQALWAEYGRLAEAHGLVWGGHFHSLCDLPHVQITYGLSLAEIKTLYQHNQNQAVWARFDQLRGVPQGEQWNKLVAQGRMIDPKVTA